MGKKSALVSFTVVLGLVSLISAVSLGGIYVLTKEPIEASEKNREVESIKQVLQEFDNNPAEDQQFVEIKPTSLTVYPAKLKGEFAGCAVKSYSDKGFGGRIEIMFGFDRQGAVTGYSVLSHAETPGLGNKMVDWFKPQGAPVRSGVEKLFGFSVQQVQRNSNVYGINPGDGFVQVSKDGGQIDAITAATISSRAFLDALNRAYEGYLKVSGGKDERGDATSGASQLNH